MVARAKAGEEPGASELGVVKKGDAAVKRENGFWAPFNSWWRDYYESTGQRPKITEFKWWLVNIAPQHYPADVWATLTMQQVKNHAKGMRDKDQVRAYFRGYRANKRAEREDAEPEAEGEAELEADQEAAPDAAGENGCSGSGVSSPGGAPGSSPISRSGGATAASTAEPSPCKPGCATGFDGAMALQYGNVLPSDLFDAAMGNNLLHLMGDDEAIAGLVGEEEDKEAEEEQGHSQHVPHVVLAQQEQQDQHEPEVGGDAANWMPYQQQHRAVPARSLLGGLGAAEEEAQEGASQAAATYSYPPEQYGMHSAGGALDHAAANPGSMYHPPPYAHGPTRHHHLPYGPHTMRPQAYGSYPPPYPQGSSHHSSGGSWPAPSAPARTEHDAAPATAPYPHPHPYPPPHHHGWHSAAGAPGHGPAPYPYYRAYAPYPPRAYYSHGGYDSRRPGSNAGWYQQGAPPPPPTHNGGGYYQSDGGCSYNTAAVAAASSVAPHAYPYPHMGPHVQWEAAQAQHQQQHQAARSSAAQTAPEVEPMQQQSCYPSAATAAPAPGPRPAPAPHWAEYAHAGAPYATAYPHGHGAVPMMPIGPMRRHHLPPWPPGHPGAYYPRAASHPPGTVGYAMQEDVEEEGQASNAAGNGRRSGIIPADDAATAEPAAAAAFPAVAQHQQLDVDVDGAQQAVIAAGNGGELRQLMSSGPRGSFGIADLLLPGSPDATADVFTASGFEPTKGQAAAAADAAVWDLGNFDLGATPQLLSKPLLEAAGLQMDVDEHDDDALDSVLNMDSLFDPHWQL